MKRLDRRGFALIAVLWVVTLLAAIVGLSMGAARLGSQASVNRLVLARGRWAAEACLAIAQARWVQRGRVDTEPVDLGRAARCSMSFDDPASRVNVNTADPALLRALGMSDTLVRLVIEARRQTPVVDIDQLTQLPGFDSSWASLLTVDGPGSINLSTASAVVLRSVSGLTAEVVDRVLYRRAVGRPMSSLDELAANVSPVSRSVAMDHYADLARLITFSAPQLVVRATGWVEGFGPRATIELVVVPLPERLAVVGRRMW